MSPAFTRLLGWAALGALAMACSTSTTDTGPFDANITFGGDSGTSRSDAGHAKESGAPVSRGPMSIAIPNADPNGIFWDSSNDTLYIADNENDQVIT